MKYSLITLSAVCVLLIAYSQIAQDDKYLDSRRNRSDDFKYWYNNEAEISSYELEQARYGELHKGHAVLVFVSEPFTTKTWTKSDQPKKGDISVLKLNFVKKFNTGVYPYSLMTSTFFPFTNGEYSLKISSTSQEWCGHTYMELLNKDKFQISSFSYFEKESHQEMTLKKAPLEDDIWSKIRLNPTDLPTGRAELIPAFTYLRLMQQPLKAYQCNISTESNGDMIIYTIKYLQLERILTISYEKEFPHKIISWKETYQSGWGANRKMLTTTARLKKSIMSDYWNKNSNKDVVLRDSLGL